MAPPPARRTPDSPAPTPSDETSKPSRSRPKETASSTTRRRNTEKSKTRTLLIDVTAQLMLKEGHTAVTARRVAAEAGVHSGLVHYYFETMNDLFLAVYRRGAEAYLRRQARALATRQPLQSLWKISTDPRGAEDVRIISEFMALAQSHETIRAEVAAYGERARELEKKAFARILSKGAANGALSPAAASVLIDGVSRSIAMERAVGLTDGHDEVIALIGDYLRQLDPPDSDE
ncbi:TetR/AcrR family transcriptional regulator [Yinghuangia sp. YIM S10712]|uniref:TetR/AcrR family transcriptional regulator n=1 Tax=Yinghuangia sp. YIM S10712 TaxID=3436930 RepID=UPI003F530494